MTPLTTIDATHVRCPQCRVMFRTEPPVQKLLPSQCSEPGCKRRFRDCKRADKSRKIRSAPVIMYIDPADIERGVA
jgi:hypothetical protein